MGEIAVWAAVGARVRAARPAKHHQGASGGSWVCFRRLINVFGHFRWNYHEFSSVLHGYRHFHSTVRCCCGRQSPKVKNLKIRGFEHFFSPASDRFGRLSSRFRALLGWIKKPCIDFSRFFLVLGEKVSRKSLFSQNHHFWESPIVILKGSSQKW